MIASTGERRRCTSTRISTRGPTASRTAPTLAAANSRSAWSTNDRHGPGNGSNLRGVVAQSHRVQRAVCAFLGRIPMGPAAVDAQRRPDRASEQVVDRLVEGFAGDVPHGDLQPADRAVDVHGAALEKHVLVGPVTEVADLHRVAADEVALHLLDVRRDRRIAVPLRVRLAPTDDSVVGGDLYEHPVLGHRRVHYERFDVLDFHFSFPVFWRRRCSGRINRPGICYGRVAASGLLIGVIA